MSEATTHDCPALTDTIQAVYDKHLDALRDEIWTLVDGSPEDTLHALSQVVYNLRVEADTIDMIVAAVFPEEDYDPTFEDAPTPLFTIPTSTSPN